MNINIQPVLEDEKTVLYPLQERDFEDLYAVARDPKIWEQHPSNDRWKKEVFSVFFEGAMQSGGAFKIVEKATGKIIGSTRIYNYNKEDNSVFIGYTFYGVDHWGKGINRAVKVMMLDYLFRFISTVYLHVGANNIRSQIAVERLGAEKIAEQEIAYHGEKPRLNFVYAITRKKWNNREENK